MAAAPIHWTVMIFHHNYSAAMPGTMGSTARWGCSVAVTVWYGAFLMTSRGGVVRSLKIVYDCTMYYHAIAFEKKIMLYVYFHPAL